MLKPLILNSGIIGMHEAKDYYEEMLFEKLDKKLKREGRSEPTEEELKQLTIELIKKQRALIDKEMQRYKKFLRRSPYERLPIKRFVKREKRVYIQPESKILFPQIKPPQVVQEKTPARSIEEKPIKRTVTVTKKRSFMPVILITLIIGATCGMIISLRRKA
jgi:hypothetical protein